MSAAKTIKPLRIVLRKTTAALRMLAEPDPRQKSGHAYALLCIAEYATRKTWEETK